MITINEYLLFHKKVEVWSEGYTYRHNVPHVVCADGFRMSVQASGRHYCETDEWTRDEERQLWFTNKDTVNSFTHVEIGKISTPEPDLDPFIEERGAEHEVYLDVPVEIVDAIIAKHGGIVAHLESQPAERGDA